MKNCPKCNNMHDNQGTYCSRSCANSRTFTEESKLKKSISAKNSEKVLKENKSRVKKLGSKMCPICFKTFNLKSSKPNQKTCSKECSYKYISLTTKGKTGGYREGSGRSHSGYYKDIYCGSTYELVWVMYNLHHNNPFKRFEGYILYNDSKKYYPDFIINNTIYEIKGFFTQTVEDKCQAAIKQGYEIKVLYKEDLNVMFDWFKEIYPNKKLKDMYENVVLNTGADPVMAP